MWHAIPTHGDARSSRRLDLLERDAEIVRTHLIEPTLPDANRHGISLGAGIKFGPLSVDVAYMHLFQPTAHKRNMAGADAPPFIPTGNGSYNTDIDILVVSGGIEF